jgi:hypothetical protein
MRRTEKINWARLVAKHSRSVGGDRLVMFGLASMADAQGLVRLSIKEMGELSSVGERQVRYSLRKLEELGEIEMTIPGGGRGRPAVYRLLKGANAPTLYGAKRGHHSAPFIVDSESSSICIARARAVHPAGGGKANGRSGGLVRSNGVHELEASPFNE